MLCKRITRKVDVDLDNEIKGSLRAGWLALLPIVVHLRAHRQQNDAGWHEQPKHMLDIRIRHKFDKGNGRSKKGFVS